MKKRKAVITFPGVIPDSDDFAGHWVISERSIVLEIEEDCEVEEMTMELLREGNFDVEVPAYDNYSGEVLNKENLVEISKTQAKYEDFYEEVFNKLYIVGIETYVKEYGVDWETASEMQEEGACVNEEGINEDAFCELMHDHKDPSISI